MGWSWNAVALIATFTAGAAGAREPVTPRIITDPATLFNPEHYPPEAQRARQEGRVVVALTISPAGAVTDCRVKESANAASLDLTTCSQARLAMFAPARDRRGRPVTGEFLLPVRWVLAEDGTAFVNDRTIVRASVKADGAMPSCKVERVSAGNADTQDICSEMARMFAAMAQDISKTPDVKQVDLMIVIDTILDEKATLAEQPLGNMTLMTETSLTFDIQQDGSVTGCRSTVVFGEAEADMSICDGSNHFVRSANVRQGRQVVRMAYAMPSN